ncbi:MAG: metallophosphoesterase family protein [Candidatus Firestonebacteria bacterium]
MSKLIQLNTEQKTIFIGDIHGDLETLNKILELYNPIENRLVFLGDYVDRGNKSKEVLDILFELKNRYANNIIMLMGNHEAYPVIFFKPTNFWEATEKDEAMYKYYSQNLVSLPLAVSIGNIIALHAALPDIANIEEISNIPIDAYNQNFIRMIWADFADNVTGKERRPTFDQNYFTKIMDSIGKKILIRSHDPKANVSMFNERCITLMTSRFYSQGKRIAIVSGEDIKIEYI